MSYDIIIVCNLRELAYWLERGVKSIFPLKSWENFRLYNIYTKDFFQHSTENML